MLANRNYQLLLVSLKDLSVSTSLILCIPYSCYCVWIRENPNSCVFFKLLKSYAVQSPWKKKQLKK